jgi:hypothetical protein
MYRSVLDGAMAEGLPRMWLSKVATVQAGHCLISCSRVREGRIRVRISRALTDVSSIIYFTIDWIGSDGLEEMTLPCWL